MNSSVATAKASLPGVRRNPEKRQCWISGAVNRTVPTGQGYYHPFLCWDSTWWRVYDTQRPHKQADAFQERMRRKYPQAYSHYPADPSNTSEIEAEYTRFMFDYCRSRGTCAGGIPSCSRREPSAQEKSIAWTLVTGDPVLGHALGHSDDDRKSD